MAQHSKRHASCRHDDDAAPLTKTNRHQDDRDVENVGGDFEIGNGIQNENTGRKYDGENGKQRSVGGRSKVLLAFNQGPTPDRNPIRFALLGEMLDGLNIPRSIAIISKS